MGAPDPPADPDQVMSHVTASEDPKLELRFDEPEKPPHTEKTEAERRRERGYLGSRQSLINSVGGVGTNTGGVSGNRV